MKNKYAAAVIGARGYTGLETTRLLLDHPFVSDVSCYATSEFDLSDVLPHRKSFGVRCHALSASTKIDADIIFLATPAEASLELSLDLVKSGKKVIDLSGAFRLKTSSYKQWYGFEHTSPELLAAASYGLSPWSKGFTSSTLVANPGCYATATLMGLVPLIKAGVIETDSLVIDGKSGATGAGRKAAENLLFTEVGEDCRPYRIGRHQHIPEIREALMALTGVDVDFHFSTHLLPIRRGMTVGIYGRLKKGADEQSLKAAFADVYAQDSLVEFGNMEQKPFLASVRRVVGSPRTQIAYQVEGSKFFLFVAIDNLLKGAASQAVENMNHLLGLPADSGLTAQGGFA